MNLLRVYKTTSLTQSPLTEPKIKLKKLSEFGYEKENNLFLISPKKGELTMVNHDEPPFSTRYSNLAKHGEDNPSLPKRNTVSKNIFYKVEKIVHGNKDWLPFKEDNWITDEDQGFANAEEMNYKLKEDAKVFDVISDFEPIRFSKIRVQK